MSMCIAAWKVNCHKNHEKALKDTQGSSNVLVIFFICLFLCLFVFFVAMKNITSGAGMPFNLDMPCGLESQSPQKTRKNTKRHSRIKKLFHDLFSFPFFLLLFLFFFAM